jgi:hypothetical protein
MAEVYHKTLGGRVTWVELTRDEVASVIERAPHEWAASPRGFAKWPLHTVRGVPVIPPSMADEAKPIASSLWKR